jgi:DNA end-binding protein Ku
MPRSIWKGAIAFGLVHVPVALYPASQEDDIDFDWLDKRSMDPVGYQRINKRTGKTITKENIVKGVKQEDGTYVLVDDDEIRNAYPKTMQTIEIEAFVKASEIPFVYLEKPYYLEPIAKADKVYALLREAMIAHDVIGIARVVMHTKEHLAALMPDGPMLVLNTLRWATEVRQWDELRIPAAGKAAASLKDAELKMAGQLVSELTVKWKADTYHDNFAEAIKRLIKAKVQAGNTHEVTPVESPADNAAPSNVVDLTALLKNSLGKRRGPAEETQAAAAAPARKTAAKAPAKAAARTRTAAKKVTPAARAKATPALARKRA